MKNHAAMRITVNGKNIHQCFKCSRMPPPAGAVPTAAGGIASTNTLAAASRPITATSRVQASSSGPALTPAVAQTPCALAHRRLEILGIEGLLGRAPFDFRLGVADRQQRFFRGHPPTVGISVVELVEIESVR